MRDVPIDAKSRARLVREILNLSPVSQQIFLNCFEKDLLIESNPKYDRDGLED